jgi:hypothetical protein
MGENVREVADNALQVRKPLKDISDALAFLAN